MCSRVDAVATGKRIHRMMADRGITPKDVARECRFSGVQAIYKWFHGESLPTIDNLVILAWMFEVTIDDIVVVERG